MRIISIINNSESFEIIDNIKKKLESAQNISDYYSLISKASNLLLSLRSEALLMCCQYSQNTVDEIDRTITSVFNITVEQEYLDKDNYVYHITFPFVIPKRGKRIEQELLDVCIKAALKEYHRNYGTKIFPFSQPVLFFENKFVDAINTTHTRDADNYEIGSIINALQNIFFGDDRDVTIVIKNTGNCKRTETVLHIFSYSCFPLIFSNF